MNGKKISYKYNIFKLLAASLLLVSVTCCWFIFTKNTSVDSIKLEVTGVISVTISDVNKEHWDNKVEVDSLSKSVITEMSGNGEKLYKPIIEKNAVKAFLINDQSLVIDEKNDSTIEKGYIELITYVRTNGPICLYLSPESSVTPVSDTKIQDNIAGAIRVAVLTEDNDPFIWAPNSTYEYDPETNSVNKSGTPEDKYTYVYKDSEETTLTPSDIKTIDNTDLSPVGVSDDKRFVWGNLNEIENYVSSVDPIFKTPLDLTEEVQYQMVIRIWIEGTDREAVKSLVGGKFNINLTFLAVDNK